VERRGCIIGLGLQRLRVRSFGSAGRRVKA
jgi:hypothetical protein